MRVDTESIKFELPQIKEQQQQLKQNDKKIRGKKITHAKIAHRKLTRKTELCKARRQTTTVKISPFVKVNIQRKKKISNTSAVF